MKKFGKLPPHLNHDLINRRLRSILWNSISISHNTINKIIYTYLRVKLGNIASDNKRRWLDEILGHLRRNIEIFEIIHKEYSKNSKKHKSCRSFSQNNSCSSKKFNRERRSLIYKPIDIRIHKIKKTKEHKQENEPQ